MYCLQETELEMYRKKSPLIVFFFLAVKLQQTEATVRDGNLVKLAALLNRLSKLLNNLQFTTRQFH